MPRIPGPQDVPLAPLRNNRRVIEIAANDSGRRQSAVAAGVEEILNRSRDQQIENEVASAEMRTRRALDELRVEMENAGPTSEGEPDLPAMWDERAQRIVESNAGSLTAPAARRAWQDRSNILLTQERAGVLQLQQRRTVERARAGFMSSISEAQTTLTDENATPEARAQALQVIETLVGRAVQRRTIAADDGARMLAGARQNVAEFEREQGMRATAQAEEDRIWTESSGDLDAALEAARDLDNPTLRDMVTDRLTARFSQARAGRDAAREGAMGRAYAHIERGGSLESLPRADREIIIDAGQMDTLRTYQRNRSGGADGAGWTEMTRASSLVRDQLLGVAADPDRARFFARVDLYAPLSEQDAASLGAQPGTVIASLLMPGDLNQLAERQRQLRGEVPFGQGQNTLVDRAFNSVLPLAQRRAAALGLAVTGTAEANRERRGMFESYIYNEVRDYVTVNNRLPTPQDMERIAADALRESQRPGVLGVGRGSFRRFQAGSLTDDPDDVEINVPFSAIPQWQVERLTRIWAQQGNQAPPTPRDIESMYSVELTRRGQGQ